MSGNIIAGGVFYRIVPGCCAWRRSAPDNPQPSICDLNAGKLHVLKQLVNKCIWLRAPNQLCVVGKQLMLPGLPRLQM